MSCKYVKYDEILQLLERDGVIKDATKLTIIEGPQLREHEEYNEETKEAYWKYKHWGLFGCSHCGKEENHFKDKYCRECGYKMHWSYQSLWGMEENE
jgi:peptide methionine sulfoxide reductase MsrB